MTIHDIPLRPCGIAEEGGLKLPAPQPPSITILSYLRLNTLYPRHSKINHVYAYRPSGLLVTPFHRNLKLWVRIPPHLFSTLPVSAFSWFIHLKQTNFYFYHPQSSTIPLQFPVTNLCGVPSVSLRGIQEDHSLTTWMTVVPRG